MKKGKLKIGKISRLAVIVFFVLGISACEKKEAFTPGTDDMLMSSTFSADNLKTVTVPCEYPLIYDLIAGQHTVAGSIMVTNTEDFLYITYTTSGGWMIGKTHLYVGSLEAVPLNKKGNPKIGLFPYKESFEPMTNSFTYALAIDDLEDCFVVAAHAEVHLYNETGDIIQSETAWGSGNKFTHSGSWAMYLEYCKQICEECVIDPVVFDFFGGQTILVGNLRVTNDEDFLYVTFNTEGMWYLGHTHLYVGSLAGLPLNNANTPVPGQFPHNEAHDPFVQSYTVTLPLDGLDECYILAAHAEVHLSDGNGNIIQLETAWSFGDTFSDTGPWGWYSTYCTQFCQ